MAKKIKETIITSYKTTAEGTFDNEKFTIQPEDENETELKKLFNRFNGEYVKITIEKKIEKEVEE
ncbi:MAG: hypothetical protein PHT02_00100 [Tissierellia bacterium]|nr:hypothetical protein [Tissierellia bacterium]